MVGFFDFALGENTLDEKASITNPYDGTESNEVFFLSYPNGNPFVIRN